MEAHASVQDDVAVQADDARGRGRRARRRCVGDDDDAVGAIGAIGLRKTVAASPLVLRPATSTTIKAASAKTC